MKQTLVTIGLMGCFAAALGFSDGAERDEGIKKTALNYVEGWYDGDAARMEKALHPDLAKRALMPGRGGRGKIEQMSAMTLVQYTRAREGKPTPADQRTANVTILDVTGNAATVKAEMHDWIDYMHLSRSGGEWKIVNVLWEFKSEAKKRMKIPEDL